MIGEMLSESPWLLPLAQGSACIAAGLAASYLLKHRAARAHQALLTAVLAAVLMPGLYVLARHFEFGVLASRTIPPAVETAVSQLLDDALPSDLSVIEADGEPAPLYTMKPAIMAPAGRSATIHVPRGTVAVAGWLGIAAVLLTRLALRFVLGLRLVRTARPLESEHLCRAVEQAKSRFGVSGPVHIRCSERVPSPVIWCWTRQPVLLVHESASDPTHGTDWAGVFCHELAHWKRLDHVSGLFVEVLTAVFPWHPLLWWARGRLLSLSEQVCDDWVLAGGRIAVDYAESLLDLSPGGQAAFVPTVVGKEKAMKERIRRIVKDGCGDPKIGVRWAVAVSLVAVLASVGVALAQRRPAPQPGEFEKREAVEPRERPESPDPAQAARRRALERMLDRVSAQIRDKEAAFRDQADQPAEEKDVLKFELEMLREQADQIKRRLRNPDEPRPARPQPREGMGEKRVPERMERDVRIEVRRSPDFDARLDDLKRQRGVLAEKAQVLEQELKGLRDDQDQEAGELKAQLERLHVQMAEIDRQLVEFQRARVESERVRLEWIAEQARRDVEQARRETDERAQELGKRYDQARREMDERAREAVKHQEQLRKELTEIERGLQKRKEQGEGDGPESRELRERLRVLSEELRAAETMRAPQKRPPMARGERQTPEGAEGKTVVRVFKFRQATTPERVRDALQPVLGGAGQITITVDARTNSVIVTTTPDKMAQVERIVRELDAPTGNRNLEAEVEELRNQMNGMREQIHQMQKLLEQVAERGRTSETQEMKEY